MFLIMERLEGESLASYLQRRGPLSVREALSVAYSTLDVIVSAHAKNILHRDLKPENLFVTRDGEIKVLDFGVAGFKTTAADSATPDSGLTCSRTLLGTPGFMPPEQALGRHDDVDERSELWAVGATVFALLTGHVVHESRTSNEILIYTATRPAPSLVSALPNASPELAYWVDRALAFDRNHRWQSAKEMQNALRALLETELSRSRRSRSLIGAMNRAPRRSFSVAMMAVMTVMAFSGGFWACTAQSRQEVVHAPVPVFGLAVDIAPIKALDADPAIANDDNAPKVVRIDDLPRIDQDRSTQRRRVRSGADHSTPENSGSSDAAKEKRRSKILQLRREKGRNVIA
jgi:serine/threonine protein kinase